MRFADNCSFIHKNMQNPAVIFVLFSLMWPKAGLVAAVELNILPSLFIETQCDLLYLWDAFLWSSECDLTAGAASRSEWFLCCFMQAAEKSSHDLYFDPERIGHHALVRRQKDGIISGGLYEAVCRIFARTVHFHSVCILWWMGHLIFSP